MNLWWLASAICFVFLYCVNVVIHKHNKIKQKRCQNAVKEIRKFLNCYSLIQRKYFRKLKVLNCYFARLVSRLGIFRCLISAGVLGCF